MQLSAYSHYIAIVCIALSLGVLGLLYQHETRYSEARTIGMNVASFEDLSDRFRTLAQGKGGAYAFSVLGMAPLPPQTDLHLLGHVVGDELYTQEGIDGIRLCTPDFRNACSHSIVIGALAEFGDDGLPKIRDACRDAPGGSGAYTMCFHGLGHGVLAGYGYEIAPTIDFCERTGTDAYGDQEYIECFGGAVMELVGGGGHDRALWEAAREQYLTSPLALCTSSEIPDELREVCLVYITPEIWSSVGIELARPQEDLFADAFLYCDTLPADAHALRRACYGGFGKEFVPLAGARDIRDINAFTDEEFTRAIRWCGFAGNEDGVAWCVSEALDSIFWGGENDPDAAFRFCGLVNETLGAAPTDTCYEQLASNIGFYITDIPLRSALCERIPIAEHTALCGQ